MKELILQELHRIEEEHQVKILLAAESGSRAWGFASTDSDYDVRFVYVRKKDAYLRLDEQRDVIELPISDELDINGWDLSKALRLLYKSNPTLFEWFASPIVYREDEDFCGRFRPLMTEYFSPKNGLCHYLSMAKRNYRTFLCGDTIKLKKYFYVLRPMLACKWILDKGRPAPMLFETLMEAELDRALVGEVKRLLELKKNTPEVRIIPRVAAINTYVEETLEELSQAFDRLPEYVNPGWDVLNEIFITELNR